MFKASARKNNNYTSFYASGCVVCLLSGICRKHSQKEINSTCIMRLSFIQIRKVQIRIQMFSFQINFYAKTVIPLLLYISALLTI